MGICMARQDSVGHVKHAQRTAREPSWRLQVYSSQCSASDYMTRMHAQRIQQHESHPWQRVIEHDDATLFADVPMHETRLHVSEPSMSNTAGDKLGLGVMPKLYPLLYVQIGDRVSVKTRDRDVYIGNVVGLPHNSSNKIIEIRCDNKRQRQFVDYELESLTIIGYAQSVLPLVTLHD